MTGNVVGIGVGVLVKGEHILTGDVNGHVVEGGLHDAAGPTSLVCHGHLIKPVTGRGGGDQEGGNNLATEEFSLEGDGHRVETG